MEEKLDELIALTKLQNNAWEHCLNMLNSIATMMNEKHNAQENLLQEHPTLKKPADLPPSQEQVETPTVGSQKQPNPFNAWNDTSQYGTDVEETINPNTQSFPASEDIRPGPPTLDPIYTEKVVESNTSSEPSNEYGKTTTDHLEHPPEEYEDQGGGDIPSVQGAPVQSKAELLERQGSTS